MSTRELWLSANEDFLSGRLGWLKERLAALAESGPGDSSDRGRARGHSGARTASVRSMGHRRFSPRPPTPVAADGEFSEIPAVALARMFALTDFEADIVLLCGAMELDSGMAAACALAHHDQQAPYPTFALAMSLFDDPAWTAMSPERPLRYWPLIQMQQPPGQPLLTARLGLDERLVNYLKGLNHLDGRLRPLLEQVPLPNHNVPPSQQQAATTATQADDSLILLLGPHQGSKQRIAAHAAALHGGQLYRIDAGDLAETTGSAKSAARLWQRESILSNVALYIDAFGIDAASPEAAVVRRWLSNCASQVFLDIRDRWPGLTELAIDVAKPTAAEQYSAWLPAAGPMEAARLAGQFDFELDTISAALGQSRSDAGLWAAAKALARPALDQLAQRVDATAMLKDLKLPGPEAMLLTEIAAQVQARSTVYSDYGFGARMARGQGISVLFAGESGTGKTMAAEALAGELDLLLYRIDLSAVISKYIGETEKNLRTLFDAAENGGAVLFFDEADALFGKRSEVKDSHDRYANIEVSYLLQRMEQFRGLAVLATNRKDSLDTAFLRRLRFVVNFPFPAVAQRRDIWSAAFPAAAPVDHLDLDRLAQLNLTGGSISNVALNAAFLAASDGGRVTMPLVLSAARTEFRKMEKPLNGSDFQWQEPEAGHGH